MGCVTDLRELIELLRVNADQPSRKRAALEDGPSLGRKRPWEGCNTATPSLCCNAPTPVGMHRSKDPVAGQARCEAGLFLGACRKRWRWSQDRPDRPRFQALLTA